jgi:Flp pilus assembly protein TadG
MNGAVHHNPCKRGARIGNRFGSAANGVAAMETRLIIAYSLIAVMAALIVIGVMLLSKQRGKNRERDSGRGSHMQDHF